MDDKTFGIASDYISTLSIEEKQLIAERVAEMHRAEEERKRKLNEEFENMGGFNFNNVLSKPARSGWEKIAKRRR